jgi:multidrug efflux pump subunit AcrA (membrane-fusion protein)
MRVVRFGTLPLVLAALVTVGCAQQQSQGPQPLPKVEVSTPITRVVTDYEVFTGRTEALNAVDVRARVSGYLERLLFHDGQDVKEGDVLADIDPRTYEADLNRMEADVARSETLFEIAERNYKRIEGTSAKVLSPEDRDKYLSDWKTAQAQLRFSRAARDVSKLNLEYTHVLAPFSGRISRRLVDPGNLVKADDTIICNIVQDRVNPEYYGVGFVGGVPLLAGQDQIKDVGKIYAYFDVDERTMLKVRKKIQEGEISEKAQARTEVWLGTSDQTGFSTRGRVNFVDNKLDVTTGTLRERGVFDNPMVKGTPLLSPGMFVRIKLPIGTPHPAVLISEQALGSDQGQRFLYVVKPDENDRDDKGNPKDKSKQRRVEVGSLQDGYRVISKGLAEGERVVVSGLQRIRDGSVVKAESVEMPRPKGDPAVTPPVVRGQPDGPAKAEGGDKPAGTK